MSEGNVSLAAVESVALIVLAAEEVVAEVACDLLAWHDSELEHHPVQQHSLQAKASNSEKCHLL